MQVSMGDLTGVIPLKREKSIESEGYDCIILVHNNEFLVTNRKLSSVVRAAIDNDPCLTKEITILPCNDVPAGRIVYSPTGPLDVDYDDVRSIKRAAYAGTKRAIKAGLKKPLVVLHEHPRFQNAELVTLLAVLEAAYVPIQMRELKPALQKLEYIGVAASSSDKTETLIKTALILDEGVRVARDIADADPERMSPPKVRDYVQQIFKDSSVTVKVEEISKANYPLFEAVNRAASDIERHRGCVIFLEYNPPDSSKIKDTLLFVGKGVTYDTGGADIKAGGVMAGMSRDKCGAAAVAGFMRVVNLLKPKDVRVISAMSMVRNSVGSNAYVSDEIIKARSGALVRIGNTDAEGRMVMADVLCELKDVAVNAVNPHLFTIATLTGHAVLAVGDGYTIVIDNGPARNEFHASQLQKSGGDIADPFEISTLRREDFDFHRGKLEGDDIMQSNNAPSSRTPRGHQGPAAFLILASGLDKHGSGNEKPLKYSHIDIAASSGCFPDPATGSPVVALANMFLLKRNESSCCNLKSS